MCSASKKGQNILEYAILLCIILSSLLIMQVFIKRAYQGRLKSEADNIGQQYSVGHTTSKMVTDTDTTTTTCTGGNCWGVDIDAGMTVSISKTDTTIDKKEGVDAFKWK